MSQPNPPILDPPQASPPDPTLWVEELRKHLARAAQLAAANGIDGDNFKRAAWSAYLDARPGLRERLVDKQLRARLRKLRKRGLVASA